MRKRTSSTEVKTILCILWHSRFKLFLPLMYYVLTSRLFFSSLCFGLPSPGCNPFDSLSQYKIQSQQNKYLFMSIPSYPQLTFELA